LTVAIAFPEMGGLKVLVTTTIVDEVVVAIAFPEMGGLKDSAFSPMKSA
jgi:hypothetical protein